MAVNIAQLLVQSFLKAKEGQHYRLGETVESGFPERNNYPEKSASVQLLLPLNFELA